MKGCGRTQNKYFEAEPTSLVAGIQIKHLHKVLFQGQIVYYPCPVEGDHGQARWQHL